MICLSCCCNRLRIPFTTGLLLGIGEERRDIIDGLLAIRKLHERHGHIQESLCVAIHSSDCLIPSPTT